MPLPRDTLIESELGLWGRMGGLKPQMSFAEGEFAGKKRVTRKEALLGAMEKVVAAKRLVERL